MPLLVFRSPSGRRFPRGLAALAAVLALGCGKSSGGDLPTPSASAPPLGAPGSPNLPPELAGGAPRPSASAKAPPPDAPLVVGPPSAPEWDGPHLVVTQIAAAIYAEPRFDKAKKTGYVRNGAKLAVKRDPVGRDGCTKGWLEVVGGGYVCASMGTLDPKDKALAYVMKQPELGDVLPYAYARNAKNGTPLYKSVPTPEQMYGYEPYLEAAKEWKKKQAADAEADAEDEPRESPPHEPPTPPQPRAEATASSSAAPADAPPPAPPEGAPPAPSDDPASPWWHDDGEEKKLHEVTLKDMQAEADDILSMRMMQGFYVAVDKTFRWNDRLWYKTTKGLVAPADRFWQVAGSKFQGVELRAKNLALPIGFTYGSAEKVTLYALDSDDKLKPAGSLAHFAPVGLTGEERKIARNDYLKTTDGHWVKASQVRVAKGAEPRTDIGPSERWVDIDVTSQTLVAYVGQQPVYATLVSTGKESTIEAKDHRTPRGEWRIREKHLATTMDGDGSAAGDLPYSIEDVPYVAYFHRSYALHAAFWHQNYGVRMSHGCVNLAPLDAKWVFFFTDPQLPAGWHGVSSSEKQPGSRIVVHE